MSRDFNGSGDYLSHAAAVISGPPFTFAARFNIDSIASVNTLLAVMGSANSHGHHMSILTDGRGALQARDSAGIFRNAFSSNTYSIGEWGSCVGRSSSATNREVVLNGDVANGGINSTSCSPASLDITETGRFQPTGTSFLNGRGAELAIWAGILTDDDVRAYHDGFSPRLILPSALVAYWQLLGNNSPEPDHIGGFAFTLTGTPAKAEHPRVYLPKKKKRYVFIAGTSIYQVPIITTVPRSASIQRRTDLVMPSIPVHHAVSAARIGQLIMSVRRIGVIALVTQIPAIIRIAINVTVERAVSVTRSTTAAIRKFAGSAGLGLLFRPVTRWTRRRR